MDHSVEEKLRNWKEICSCITSHFCVEKKHFYLGGQKFFQWLTSLGASHDIQDPEDVDLTVLDCGVAVDAGDGANVHLAPLVRVKGEDERHGIVNAGIRVDYELAPLTTSLVCKSSQELSPKKIMIFMDVLVPK